MENSIDKKFLQYKQLKLSWNISSMLLINKAGFLLEDMMQDDYLEALILIMTAGDSEHNSIKIKKFLNKYISEYNEIDSIRCFVIYDLKNIHGFISEKEEDDEPIHPLLKDKEDKKTEKTHDEKLKINKENYDYMIRVYMKAGYSLEDVLKKDLSNFDIIQDFVISEHEEKLNDLMLLAHRVGFLAGVGFVNMKNYPDKPEKIRLKPLSKEEIIAQKEAEAKKFFTDAMNEMQ